MIRWPAPDCVAPIQFQAQAVFVPGESDFRIRSTDRIVFQLRVVAGAPKFCEVRNLSLSAPRLNHVPVFLSAFLFLLDSSV
jgi:hypothetical protein